MGGKGDDGGGQQDQTGANLALITQQQQAAAQQAKQQTAAGEPVKRAEEKKEEAPIIETNKPPPEEAVVPGSENLTGLGDAMVAGLSPGRQQQVGDQVARVGANPQTYGPGFDPYTGTFAGQGPYNVSGSV